MIGRVIEVASDGRHLALDRGFMAIKGEDGEVGRVPLDDVGVLLINAHGITYSNSLLVALAERGAAVVLCGRNHLPAAWLWPLEGHHVQAMRMDAQLAATRPLCKRLWQLIVKAKIEQQAAIVGLLDGSGDGIAALARRVRSGDPDNLEAQAARRYWPLVMGEDFRRDRAAPGTNALLNYGYTVLRAATARAVVAAGLHPSVGIHHSNRSDHLRLADDLMEPFRPLVDYLVVRLRAAGVESVTPDAKHRLALVTSLDMSTVSGRSPLGICLERLALSLAKSFETGTVELDLPIAPLPLDLAGMG